MIKRTPNTLGNAIENGLTEWVLRFHEEKFMGDVVEAHVKDFLKQKLGAAILNADSETVRAICALAEEIGVPVHGVPESVRVA